MIMLLVLGLLSCKTKYVQVPYEVIKRDSIVNTVTIRDTILKYPTQFNQVLAKNYSKLKTDLAFSIASVDSLGLHHSIQNFGVIPSKVIEKKSYIRTQLNITKTIVVTNKEIVYKAKRDFIWYSGLFLYILLALYFGYKIYKFKFLK